MSAPQTFSHYPSWPAPLRLPLVTIPSHPCVYLPGKMSQIRAFRADEIPGRLYHELMDAGFRRSGTMIYQPACRGCRQCVPIRVLVEKFRPSKSQRRCRRRNRDLRLEIDEPAITDEKYRLYRAYQTGWHGQSPTEREFEDFAAFLYSSPVDTVEFQYRDCDGRLLAVGICDVCDRSLSSVYFYFDPAQSQRGLGTFGALCELEFARERGIPYYYLGYWIGDCAAMRYKACFRPNEMLCGDGMWRDAGEVS